MTMVYCRGCGKQIHETALACPECGAPQKPAATPIAQVGSTPASATVLSPADSLNKKLHLVMLAAAALGVIFLFTTKAFVLIGAAAGVCFGLSVRLYLAHQKTGFAGSTRLNWMLVVGGTILSLICMMAELYTVQAMFLIFVGVRGLIMYLAIYNGPAVAEPAKTE
ncbi:hypothetical protein [Polaromonas sp.]|uniref:hypothetical protein n=1 Tax=Polaromonas sp. TaxID=1869339 RepID=UPI0025D160BD|nr:hypothetical protein [Polaromonas sp.]